MKKIKYWYNEQGDYTISEDNEECYPIYAVVEIPAVAKLLCDSFNHHQSVTSLKEEVSNEIIKAKEQIEELSNLYENYLNLIDKELGELMSLAVVHGWKSSRIEEGRKARAKIQEVKDRLK